jgi:hypothetical protein
MGLGLGVVLYCSMKADKKQLKRNHFVILLHWRVAGAVERGSLENC